MIVFLPRTEFLIDIDLTRSKALQILKLYALEQDKEVNGIDIFGIEIINAPHKV